MSERYYLQGDGKIVTTETIKELFGGYPVSSTDLDYIAFLGRLMNEKVGHEKFEIRVKKQQELPDPLWQRHSSWSGDHLGYANAAATSTIGLYGCVITGIAWVNYAITGRATFPPDVQAGLVEHQGYAGDTHNLVVWERVDDAFPGIKYDGFIVTPTRPAPIDRISETLNKGGFAICQVDFKPSDQVIQSHYVVVVSLSPDQKTAKIMDPWTGEFSECPPMYYNAGWHDPQAARIFMRTALYLPA